MGVPPHPPHPVVHPPNPNPVRHLLIHPIERPANSIHTVPSAPSHALASTTWRSRAQTQSVSACECVCVRACGRFEGLNTGETRRRIPSSPPGAIAPPHDDSPFTIHHSPRTVHRVRNRDSDLASSFSRCRRSSRSFGDWVARRVQRRARAGVVESTPGRRGLVAPPKNPPCIRRRRRLRRGAVRPRHWWSAPGLCSLCRYMFIVVEAVI